MATANGDVDTVPFLTKHMDMERSESWIPSLLSVCVSHFGSSVKGISDVASEAYDNAVDLATSELVTSDPDSVLGSLLSENMATMDWNIKAKYPGLKSILARVSDLSKVLDVHKELAHGLAQSLVANQLASAGVRVYKVLIKKINCETWVKSGFGKVLIEAMQRDDEEVVRDNACNHWLPVTVNAIKSCIQGQHFVDISIRVSLYM